MAESTVRILSWFGGVQSYIGQIQVLRLEAAIAYCDRLGMQYEIAEDLRHYDTLNGD